MIYINPGMRLQELESVLSKLETARFQLRSVKEIGTAADLQEVIDRVKDQIEEDRKAVHGWSEEDEIGRHERFTQ